MKITDTHFQISAGLIVTIFVGATKYLLPQDIQAIGFQKALVVFCVKAVPVVSLIETRLSFYWALVYSIFWVIAPIFPILGFASTFYLKPEIKALAIKLSGSGAIAQTIVSIFLSLFVWCFPFKAPPFNQTSSNLVILIYSWLMPSFSLFYVGYMVGVLYVRRKANQTNF